jgi:uncharacterized membrane protein YeiB
MEIPIAPLPEQHINITFNLILASERIESLDIIRWFVLCGILLMNITGFDRPE